LPVSPAEAVTVPVPLGGALLLTNFTPHRSTENTTDVIRWSIDLRYQSRDVPNNVEEIPEEFDPNADPVTLACYPPEGDFVVRSRRDPSSVPTYSQFAERRARYEAVRIPGPRRGWEPA
jgi:phytanoyl-CoA hydroxylase